MKFTHTDTENLIELLQWRRDVRHFKPDALKMDDIQKLVQAMDLAPSVGNSRPWRIVEVESEDTRSKIIENHTLANSAAAKVYDDKQRNDYNALKLAGLREAPLQLAVFTEIAPQAGHGLGRQTMPETLQYSTVIAIHQLWLMARTLNIGVGWVSILQSEEVARILDVEENWNFTAYLCIGYPQYDDEMPELHRKGWQENTSNTWIKR